MDAESVVELEKEVETSAELIPQEEKYESLYWCLVNLETCQKQDCVFGQYP
jgi:hypothetical protein